jgi:hypothetical protein
MSTYTTSYKVRYGVPHLLQQTEVAVVHASGDIKNEDPATPDHTNRMAWANWVIKNSSTGVEPFKWPVAMNPSIAASVEADPSGESVPDADVQFVVNSNLDAVIADWVANPPP